MESFVVNDRRTLLISRLPLFWYAKYVVKSWHALEGSFFFFFCFCFSVDPYLKYWTKIMIFKKKKNSLRFSLGVIFYFFFKGWKWKIDFTSATSIKEGFWPTSKCKTLSQKALIIIMDIANYLTFFLFFFRFATNYVEVFCTFSFVKVNTVQGYGDGDIR